MKGLRIILRGQVQGVGLRFFVRSFCIENKISGRVFNRSDGSVLIEACAIRERIAKLSDLCANLALPGARVESIEKEEIDCEGESGIFEIGS